MRRRFRSSRARALLPLIADPAAAKPREVFARAANPVYPQRLALRTATHKLILTQHPFGESLFDLVADPHERTDLVRDPAAAEVLTDLRARLEERRRPRWTTGFQVRAVAQAGTNPEVEVAITSNDNQMLVDPDRVGGDRPDTLELSRDALALTWRGRVGSTPIGFRFDRYMRLRDDTGLTIRIRADGVDLPPQAIRLAGGDAQPPSSPFTYKIAAVVGQKATEDPPLLVETAPTPSAGDAPVRVHLWRVREAASASVAAPPIDEKMRERLRLLGYGD